MSNTHTELQRLLAEGDHQGAWELIENEIVSMVNGDDQQGIQDLISIEVGRMVTEGNLRITGDAARRVQDLAIRLTIPIQTEDERQHHPGSRRFRTLPPIRGTMRRINSGVNANGAPTRHPRYCNAPRDDAYDLLTHTDIDPLEFRPTELGARMPFSGPGINYAMGASHRLPSLRFVPGYDPAREAPLSSADACRCGHFTYEHAIHILHQRDDFVTLRLYEREHRRRIRSRVVSESDFPTASNRQLVEMRQTRALAGLDVSAYDVEIARRVLANPDRWGAVGSAMRRRGWVDEVIEDGEDYILH